MLQDFDIFQRRPEGFSKWVGTAATLEEAKEIVKKLASSNGHFDYFVYDVTVSKNVWTWLRKVPRTPEGRLELTV